MDPTNHYEALRLALFLALTAPSDEKAAQAAALADQIAALLSPAEIQQAATAAVDWVHAEAIGAMS